MIRLSIFLLCSAAFLAISRRMLCNPRCHGFYRFFAFELLLALILVNAPAWFQEPFSARQIVSWFLLAASIGLAIEGWRLLLSLGRPAPPPAGETNIRFENTTALVTIGAYRFIRHPMYASLLAMCWGALLKQPSGVAIGLAVGASAFLVATAIAEERENLARFGAAYAAYMKATRRFVPFIL